MAKRRTVFRCAACGGESARWVGRCPACTEWNTLLEELERPAPAGSDLPRGEPALPIVEIDSGECAACPTGIAEVDRVLAGGLVPGSVTLLGGEPGIGKSTLLLQLAASVARGGRRVLYASAEESRAQVRLRAERLDALTPRVWLASETVIGQVLGQVADLGPHLVVVDSIQTVFDPDLGSAPGSVVQVRECAHRLVREAKTAGLAVVLVGHVTKEGGLAGPRVLEHVVDTVLSFDGDRHHGLRLLRPVKHRFGSTSELGVFEMSDRGLVAIPDASGLFLADRRPGVAGSAVVPAIEGDRPLCVEVQALVAPAQFGTPRRSAEGVDAGRLALLLAVLHQRAGVKVADQDVFALAVGGVRVVEPGADLAVALAVASSHVDRALPDDLVACAEVGLGGELRQVRHTPRRLAEADRLGFRRVILPGTAPAPPAGIHALRADTLGDAIRLAGLTT
ncbi:MAG: DNA repair protein RadA [Acidimicrobiales bacterium]